VHAKGKPLAKESDLEIIARQTPGFSGADLANLINEAAILAARRNRKDVSQKELEDSIDRVIAGPEKKGRVITKNEKELIAYHETGHALAAKMLPNADPVHKISIVARGMMGGWTRFLPTEERYLETFERFKDLMVVSLAGRAAEQVAFNELTTGAQNDLEKVTQIARRMITEFGMSQKLGPRTFGKREELVFLGKEIHEQRNYSDKIAEEIDAEVEQLVKDAYAKAVEIMIQNKDRLKFIADYLIEKETIDDITFEELLNKPIPAPDLETAPAS
jgi:cell division protease FtsH